MKKYTSKQLRQIWLDFWESKNHNIIDSKSLIPIKDPSILWINSGVATLKDYFSGLKKPQNPRMANSQRCIRTNDIDNVGITSRHHTLFEMLGNFSIGDYFKKEAIHWAYEFIFEILKFPKEKIYITYYEKDKETYELWKSLGINNNNLIQGNKKTNFWEIGEGPCGPDTEIFYDRGEKYDFKKIGKKLLEKDIENDRFIEIWNVVFSQFNKLEDGSYENLAQKNIDTGAGLERIVSIFQDAPTNFDTDLFLPIIYKMESFCSFKYKIENYFLKDPKQTKVNHHFRIIADHIRAITIAIHDGAKPSNTKRGYIIRMLLRRAYRSGIQLKVKEESFLYKLVKVVSEIFDSYKIDISFVENIIKKEEISFAKTIKQGEKLLFKSIKGKTKLNFSVAYKLFETYGFPIELTKEILEEHNISLDISEFKKFQKEHSLKSKKNQKFTNAMVKQLKFLNDIKGKISKFVGYEMLKSNSKVIISITENKKHYLLLDKTPFYATSGGQIHDVGTIDNVEVEDVFKDKFNNHWHVTKKIITKKYVEAIVNFDIRLKKARNHSGTHLLGYALRSVLGKNVIQLGSENNEKRLRFDFPYDEKPTILQIEQIEKKVNYLIKSQIPRNYIIDTFENGIKMGALALEGEIDVNPQKISRIVQFDKSIEFCGGTHVENSSILENFKIIKLESKGSGTYRIEAITSNNTINKYKKMQITELQGIAKLLIEKNQKIDSNYRKDISKSLPSLNKLIIDLKKDFKILKEKKNININDLNIQFNKFNNINFYINMNLRPENIKNIAINLRHKYPNSLFIIGSLKMQKTIIAITSDVINCSELFNKISKKVNARGGGNANFAMGKIDSIHDEISIQKILKSVK